MKRLASALAGDAEWSLRLGRQATRIDGLPAARAVAVLALGDAAKGGVDLLTAPGRSSSVCGEHALLLERIDPRDASYRLVEVDWPRARGRALEQGLELVPQDLEPLA